MQDQGPSRRGFGMRRQMGTKRGPRRLREEPRPAMRTTWSAVSGAPRGPPDSQGHADTGDPPETSESRGARGLIQDLKLLALVSNAARARRRRAGRGRLV